MNNDIHLLVYLDLGFPDIFAFVSDPAETPEYAAVAWEGDSRAVLQSFPEDVRQNFGFELWQLQQGERPGDYRPLPSIGLGVFELRDQDEDQQDEGEAEPEREAGEGRLHPFHHAAQVDADVRRQLGIVDGALDGAGQSGQILT